MKLTVDEELGEHKRWKKLFLEGECDELLRVFLFFFIITLLSILKKKKIKTLRKNIKKKYLLSKIMINLKAKSKAAMKINLFWI